ncbi:hypothetical protein ACFX1Z_022250 [Malus domestica]
MLLSVGRETGNYRGFHGGHGFGKRNEDGEAILDFVMAYDLFLANTFFKKREEHVITYKSGSSKTQIDFLLMRKGDRITCRDCKVIPGESLANQHRLLVMDVHIKRVSKKNKTWKCPRTRWWNLKGEKQAIFKKKVITQCVWDREGEASQRWDSMASCIQKVAKEVLGESKGFASHQKESWWWNEEVQTKVKAKKECCKALYKDRTDENGERYRRAKQEAKKALREAKLAAYDDMYKRLDTKEGELDIYKLARAREKKTRDLNQVRCIKDEDGKVLATENAVKDRWRGYFHNLFNEGHERSTSLGELSNSEECRNYSFYCRIRKEEVVVALKKMKHRKAVGPDDIPIEVWKVLGETDDIVLIDETQEGVNAKLNLWRKVLEFKGLRLSRSKTEYIKCKFSANGGQNELGNIELDGDLNHRIQAGWIKWKSASGVLCDRCMPLKLKGKFYRTAIRLAMLYGTECWAVKHQHVHKMGVAEIRMLRWMCGHTRKDKIRNEDIRGKVGVAEIEGKLRENQLRWFGHLQRRPTDAPVRRCDYGTEVQGRRGRGRPRKTLEETLRKDLEYLDLTEAMTQDRAQWCSKIHIADPTQ